MSQHRNVLLLAIVLLSVISVSLQQGVSCFNQEYTFDVTKTDDNPLRGFFSYQDSIDPGHTTVKSSIEYDYVPWATVMTGANTFDWTPIENLLNGVKGRGRQTVFRVYVDYPDGSPAYSMPSFLSSVSNTPYSGEVGSGKSPDYSNESFVSAMETFIKAMGAKYDGDNRIAMINLGFLGHWGEWHTYPDEQLMASTDVQKRIISAYNSSFSITMLTVSADFLQYDPIEYITSTNIGFHDDDFGASTCGSDGFRARLSNNGWLTDVGLKPVGGEVQPSIQRTTFADDQSANTFISCLKSVNASMLLFYDLFNVLSADHTTRALQAHRAMGYHFVIDRLDILTPDSCSIHVPFGSKCAIVAIQVRNAGIARFYYPLSLVVVDGDNQYVATTDLHNLLPSNTAMTYTVEIQWDDNRSSVGLDVLLKSDHVIAPIKWAVSTVQTNTGAVSIAFEANACARSSATSPNAYVPGTSSGTPVSLNPTGNTNNPSSNPSSTNNNVPSRTSGAVMRFGSVAFFVTLATVALF